MNINTVITGMLNENCYVLIKDKKALIVDPGDDYPKIKEALGDNKLLGVLITHSHFDHIGALRNFLTKRSVKILKKSTIEEKEYILDNFKFKCIFTPGHSKDSVSFYFEEEKAFFCGDTIFKGTIGRTDFPGGSMDEMKQTINIVKSLPDDVKIDPGHEEETTVKEEKENNPYFQ